jgi:hypothetical protein
MAILQIDVEWFRFPGGYKLVRARDHARHLGEAPETYPDVNWIVPTGAERVPYRPFEKYDLLYLAFAKLKTPDDLMNFIEMYGPLTTAVPEWGEDVDAALRVARKFNELLIAKEKGPKRIAAVFNHQELASSIGAYQRDTGSPPPINYDHGSLNKLVGTADIIADKARGVVLRITSEVLISGLWWQLSQTLSGETNIQTCRHCGTLFETGPGTGRHIDATFCSNEHKIRYYSLARTKKSRRNA